MMCRNDKSGVGPRWKYNNLEGLKFADKYPSTGEREFEMIVSEPYFSELEVKSPNPSLPMAKLTALGWILRGAFGVSRQLITASAFGVHANEQERFDLQTIYESLSFDFAKFWSGHAYLEGLKFADKYSSTGE